LSQMSQDDGLQALASLFQAIRRDVQGLIQMVEDLVCVETFHHCLAQIRLEQQPYQLKLIKSSFLL
jgi:hypothetical protein